MNEHDDATPSERWADAVIDKRGDSTTHKQNRLSNPGNREPVLRRIVYGRIVNFAVCTSDCPLTRSRTRTSIEYSPGFKVRESSRRVSVRRCPASLFPRQSSAALHIPLPSFISP